MNKNVFWGRPGTLFEIALYGTLSVINGWYAGYDLSRPSHGIVSLVAAAASVSYALYRAFKLGAAAGLEKVETP